MAPRSAIPVRRAVPRPPLRDPNAILPSPTPQPTPRTDADHASAMAFQIAKYRVRYLCVRRGTEQLQLQTRARAPRARRPWVSPPKGFAMRRRNGRIHVIPTHARSSSDSDAIRPWDTPRHQRRSDRQRCPRRRPQRFSRSAESHAR